MKTLSSITNSIADDYLLYSGRGTNNTALITPQEYLMFRAQALEELKSGLCHVDTPHQENSVPPMEKRPTLQSKTPVFENIESQTKQEILSKANEDMNSVKENAETKIIPISSATTKTESNKNNLMLALMKKAEG